MYQLTAAGITFMLIPVLIKKKFKLSQTILITALVLAMVSGIGARASLRAIMSVFTTPSSVNTILVVMMINILGGLLKHYKILDGIVETLLQLIGSKRNIITIIPAMIGMLSIPGGAILSAPFVNEMGEDIHLSPPRRAVINLVFRHVTMFLLPFNTTFLIIQSTIPDFRVSLLILMNSVYVIGIVALGYLFFLRDIDVGNRKAQDRSWKQVKQLLVYTSPIYSCVIITGLTGVPFSLSMLVSIFIIYLMSDTEHFLKQVIKAFDKNMVFTVVAVLMMQSIILEMTDMLMVFSNLFYASDNVFVIMATLFITSLFFGFISGYKLAALAITLPLVNQLEGSVLMIHLYVYIASCCAFLGYFFSPLHLCQAFTVQVMKTNTLELYREYRWYGLTLMLLLIVTIAIFMIFI